MIKQTKIRDELVQLIGELPENEIISVKRFVEFIISQTKASFQSGRQKEKEILIKELKGCCSHLPGGSEEFIREKHEDEISDHRRKALMFRGGAEEFMRGKLEKLEEIELMKNKGEEEIELMKNKGKSEKIAMKESQLKSETLKNKYNELVEKIGKLSCGGNSVEDIRLERSR